MKKDNELMKKIVKKGTVLLLAGTMIGTIFTGCTKQKNTVLEGTLLYEAQVMTVGGETIIVTPRGNYFSDKQCFKGAHYKDVITGTVYQINDFTTEEAELLVENSQKQVDEDESNVVFNTIGDVRRHYSCINKHTVTLLEDEVQLTALTNKLTADELQKAMEGNFTDADVIAIQQRIANESTTKTMK